MPKKKRQKSVNPETRALLRKILLQCTLVIAFIAIAGFTFVGLKRYVENDVAASRTPPRIVLKDRPIWMSDTLAQQILRTAQPTSAHSVFDRNVLVNVAQALRISPWVREVHEVRRVHGDQPADTILVDCEFRAPLALVHWKDYYWLVDGQGIKLPEQFTQKEIPRIISGANGKTNIRVIDGVRHAPVESGDPWPGEDLAAGIEMAKCLYGVSWVDELTRIDVTNFGGRNDVRDPQITLLTKRNTAVRWGMAPGAKDAFVEVSTGEKLKVLKQVYADYGRIDANHPWIDIRFDKITYPSEQAAAGDQ